MLFWSYRKAGIGELDGIGILETDARLELTASNRLDCWSLDD